MALEVIDNAAALKDIEPEWLKLFDRVPGSTPFQHPCWLLTWWSHFGSGRLHVLLLRDGKRIDGILPCFLHDWDGRHQLTLVGTGISDYLDPLIDPEHRPRFINALQVHLEGWPEWELCDWQDLPATTPITGIQKCGGFDVLVSADTPCSAIPLTGTFERLWESRSKDMRRNLRRYSERARSMGAVEFETSSGTAGDAMDELVRLHAARWKKRGEAGVIAANGSEAFLREIADEFAALRLLRLFVIRFKGKIAAVVMTFPYASQVFSYMSAFDPEYEILGFGRILLYEAIQNSYRQGYTAWNFLRGEEPYKFSWGAREIPKCRVILQRRCGT